MKHLCCSIIFLFILLTATNCKYEDYDCSEGCKICPLNKVKVGDSCLDLKKDGFYYCTSPCICLDTMAIAFVKNPPLDQNNGLVLLRTNAYGSAFSTTFNCKYFSLDSGDSISTTIFGYNQFCDIYPNNKLYPVVTGKFINKSYWDIDLEWHSLKTDTVVTTCNLIFRQ